MRIYVFFFFLFLLVDSTFFSIDYYTLQIFTPAVCLRFAVRVRPIHTSRAGKNRQNKKNNQNKKIKTVY